MAPILAALVLWEYASRSSLVNPALFPPPTTVATALWQMAITGSLVNDVFVSVWRLILGLVCGATTGILIGVLTGRLPIAAKVLTPILQFLRPLPPVAIIPLVIVWFGIDNGAKIFSIAFAVFFPVWINTHIGAQHIPDSYIWSARLLTCSWKKIFWKVILPAAWPFIFAGLRSSIALAFIMVFVTELAGSSNGLGYRISITHLAYRIDEMMAALALLAALGAAADKLFVLATHLCLPWTKFSIK